MISRLLTRIEITVISTAMNSAKGFEVEIGFIRGLLRGLGIYPDPNGFKGFISRSYFLVPIALMVFFCNIPQSVAVKRVWGDFSAVLRLLTVNDIPYGMAVFKHIGLRYNADVLGQLIQSISDDWKSSKTKTEFEVMWKNAKLSRIMSITIFSLATGSTITYFVMGLVDNQNNIKQQIENNASIIIRPLYIDGDFSYDTQKSPQFEITYFLQIVSMFYASSTFSGIDAFFAVLMLHLCGQLENLKENLKSVSAVRTVKSESYSGNQQVPASNSRKKVDPNVFRRKIAVLVVEHDHLNNFATALEDSFNLMFLPQMIGTSLALCLQGYQLVVISTASEEGLSLPELFHMAYFTSCFSFSLFVYCYVAERLQSESTAIHYAAYESDWYNWAPRDARLLLLLMVRSRKPLEITAGKFCVFSLELYCSILKTCGGYISMLLAVRTRLVQN